MVVPKRWHLVSQFVGKYSDSFPERTPSFHVGVGTTEVTFDGSAEHCRKVCRDLEVHHPGLLALADEQAQILFTDASTSAFKPIVLLPPVSVCCGIKLLIRYAVDQC